MAAGGRTAVAVVTQEFAELARTMAANAGRPALRTLVLPYPLDTRPEAEVREIARAAWPAALAALGATEERAAP
ncbi:MAG: hypothetical protein ACKO1Y_03330 [Actinomycetota bacterium]